MSRLLAALAVLASVVSLIPPALGQAPHVRRLDRAPDGSASNGDAFGPRITPDGSQVLFYSSGTNLVPSLAPGSPKKNLFLVDVRTGAIEQVNLGSAGQALGVLVGSIVSYGLSADGRWVVFQGISDDPGLGDANGLADIYLRDRVAGTTELLSKGAGGTVGATTCLRPVISEDGTRVLFSANGASLTPGVPGTGLFQERLYLHDRSTGVTSLVSPLDPAWPLDDHVVSFDLSGDGSHAAFVFENKGAQVPLTLRIQDLDAGTWIDHPVTFWALDLDRSGATLVGSTDQPLVPEDTDIHPDVYLLDPVTGSLSLVSTLPPGPWDERPLGDPQLSPDGRYVSYSGKDYGGIAGSLSGPKEGQVFVRDLATGLVTLGSINDLAQPGGNPQKTFGQTALNGSLSELGDRLAYTSNYANLAKPDGGTFALLVFERRTAGPQLGIRGLVAGSSASLQVTGAAPGGAILLGMSLSGQGPIPSYWGPLHLSPPIHTTHVATDANGVAQLQLPLAAATLGLGLYAQGLDILGYQPTTPWFGVIQ